MTCAHAIKIEPDQRLVDLEAENKKLKAQVEKLKGAKGKRVSSSPLPHIFEVLCGAAKTMKTEEFMFQQKKQQQQQNLQQQRQQQRQHQQQQRQQRLEQRHRQRLEEQQQQQRQQQQQQQQQQPPSPFQHYIFDSIMSVLDVLFSWPTCETRI